MHMKRFFAEFKEFALKGSVIDLAVGIIIGTAFNGIINSLVKDIIMPPIGLALKQVDFSNLFVSISGGSYATLAEAQAAGAVTINYGLFLNLVISFIITAFVVFLMIKEINRLRRRRDSGKDSTATTKACPYCIQQIPLTATRCPFCTSELK
jgi:large conductance mechanosensitive channel